MKSTSKHRTVQHLNLSWVFDLPKNWNPSKLKHVCSISASNVDKKKIPGEDPVRLCNYTDVYYKDQITSDKGLMEGTATRAEQARFSLKGGEVLLTKDSETAEDIAIPAYVPSALPGVLCGYHLYLLRPAPKFLNGRFLARACSVSPIRDQFVIAANGMTRYGLGLRALGTSLIPVPPLGQQQAIADFLDRKTARIDALIEKKQRLIELLDEKRIALITQAVTCGSHGQSATISVDHQLFPNLPRDWSFVRLRRIIRQIKRPVTVRLDHTYREIGIRSWGKGIFHKLPVSGKQLDSKKVYSVRPQDFVLNIVFAWEGAVAVVSEREQGMIGSHRFPTFRHSPDMIELDYLLLFFQSARGRALLGFNSPGAAGRNRTIRLGTFLSEEIPLPPVAEQREIIAAFRKSEEVLMILRQRVHNLIEKLQEYRTALISAAVTGQIDVRNQG